MALGDSSRFIEDNLRERLAGARWILAAAWLGLAAAVWMDALALMPAIGLGALILVAASVSARRRPVAAALARLTNEPKPLRLGGEDRLTALVRALPDAALLLDPRGTVVVANLRASGVVASARVGDPVSFAVRVPEVLEAIRAATADGVARRIEFAERVPLDRWLRADIVPVRSAEGRGTATEAVLVGFADLTAQRRVEQMRVDFIANASHELRTPLASLSGFIETLQGPARNDAGARERFLKIMGEQARRMSRLIDDLLSLSRIEMNAHLRPETKVDVTAVLSHVRDALGPLGRERGVEIALEHPPQPVAVHGDRDELFRVFENLVENALKYGGAAGRVEIGIVREGSDVVISVRDYGPGIAPEHVPRLTERFYRVDTAHSREQGGTGLGLAIVKHIVARHRGRLGIESTPGEGSTFSVRLSACPADDTKTSTKS
ncbi:two-component system phosphate regulon sensor histidine kinase PhoR [Angulomicrobium tetraedrale]|uniref:histidine kinase n=1 Tax=Ancylobacter tetraedralis TaxID=217068 RepID=A0A839Z200_9HYPH|nr:ATP-binding protein [Ancylobacter tetraedralis]MBB3770744.1 two-component system phosphate regulon sensor histidine kinase PhoR [Ancylobacter tetraedralis]